MKLTKVKIIMFLIVIVGIFSVMFLYLKNDFDRLPSEGWSKEIKLFDIDTPSNFEDFFNKKLGYGQVGEELNVFYVVDRTIKYAKYDKDYLLMAEGNLFTADTEIENMFIETVGNEFKIILLTDGVFDLYSMSRDFVLSESHYNYVNNNEIYSISNGYLITRNGNNINLISNEGLKVLKLENRPYSLEMSIVEKEDTLDLFYSELSDNNLSVRLAIFDDAFERLETNVVGPFISTEVKFKLLDMQVQEKNDHIVLFLNIKDERNAITYLNYYEYDLSKKVLIHSKLYDEFKDKVDLVSQNDLIITSGGSDIEAYAGKLNSFFNNILVYNIDSKDYKLLTRTRLDPRNYKYFTQGGNKYLIWGELHNDKLTINLASDRLDFIEKSVDFTYDKATFVLSETMSAFLSIPTYVLMMAIPTLAIVMLIFGPGYLIFISFFERKAKQMFFLMILLHNLGKALIHFRFIGNVDLPEPLVMATIPILIFTTALGVYNSNVFKKHYKFDNILHEYIPFYLTDIILHTLIFGPYIMLDI